MKKITLAVLFCSSVSWAKPNVYVERNDSFFNPRTRVIVDGKEVFPGVFWGDRLSHYFSKDPLAQSLMEDAEYYGRWGSALFFGGLIGSLIYSASNSNTSANRGTFTAIFLGGVIPGIFLGDYANTKAVRAINQYNGVYDKETSSSARVRPKNQFIVSRRWSF